MVDREGERGVGLLKRMPPIGALVKRRHGADAKEMRTSRVRGGQTSLRL
jgi:hypothetical protein